MNQEAVLDRPMPEPAGQARATRLRGFVVYSVSVLAVLALGLVAWLVRRDSPIHPGNGLGYTLGLSGGALMLGLLLYPVRKRIRLMREWGALKHWFRFHMVGGVLGPLLILFHSGFRVGSINAGVALSCMLLVVTSGLIGRFLYRKIHHGLYGSHASLRELEQELAQQRELLAAVLHHMPQVKQEVERFAALVSYAPTRVSARAAHFLSIGPTRLLATWRLRRLISSHVGSGAAHPTTSPVKVHDLLGTINRTLQAAQRRAQFSTFERLFSLWHVIHTPFLCMLLITAIVHVVAVHSY